MPAKAFIANTVKAPTLVVEDATGASKITLAAASTAIVATALTATAPSLTLADTAGTPHTLAITNTAGIAATGTTAITGDVTQTGALSAAQGSAKSATIGTATSPTVNINGVAINLTGGDLTGTQSGNIQWVGSQVINQSASGLTVAQSALTFLANLRPTALAISQNNYSPSGSDNVSVIYLTPNAAGSAITGFRTGSTNQANRFLLFFNLSTTASITLTNQDVGSTAANRFITPGAVPLVIGPGLGLLLGYDPTQARWLVFGLG